MIFSCVIPCRDLNDPKLKDLLASIRAQDFPQDQIETIVVTEGDSEQAKAIGIRKARGEILCMLCADNCFREQSTFSDVYSLFIKHLEAVGIYSRNYRYVKDDNSLNRYFALIGCNDPIPFYLGKSDRRPFYEDDENECFTALRFDKNIPSLGCNGTFIRRHFYLETDLDHYYPMDNCYDLWKIGCHSWIRTTGAYIWHRTTDGNLIKFLIRRYKYARDLYCDRRDRRWRMLDTAQDYWRLLYFIISAVTIIPCLSVSIRGMFKVKDWAWGWHPIVCIGFLITYTILTIRCLLKYLLSFLHSVVEKLFPNVSKVSSFSPSQTTR